MAFELRKAPNLMGSGWSKQSLHPLRVGGIVTWTIRDLCYVIGKVNGRTENIAICARVNGFSG